MIRRHDFDYDRLCNYTTLHPHPHLHFSPNVSILSGSTYATYPIHSTTTYHSSPPFAEHEKRPLSLPRCYSLCSYTRPSTDTAAARGHVSWWWRDDMVLR